MIPHTVPSFPSGARKTPLNTQRARLHRGELGEAAATECAAEEEGGNQAVSGDVTVEPENVPRLLAAEERTLAPQCLEHVAVADVGGDHADPALRHQPVEAEVRHR